MPLLLGGLANLYFTLKRFAKRVRAAGDDIHSRYQYDLPADFKNTDKPQEQPPVDPMLRKAADEFRNERPKDHGADDPS
jgi:hypothetical protein